MDDQHTDQRPDPAGPDGQPSRRKRGGGAVIGLALSLLVGGGSWYLLAEDNPPPAAEPVAAPVAQVPPATLEPLPAPAPAVATEPQPQPQPDPDPDPEREPEPQPREEASVFQAVPDPEPEPPPPPPESEPEPEPAPEPAVKPDVQPPADSLEPPPAKPPVPPPLPPLDAEVERVRAALGDIRCAAVRVEAADDTLAVSGTVTSEADRAHIVSLVGKARDTVAHRVDVTVASRSLCEPLVIFEGLQAANAVRATPLTVTPAGPEARFRGGEALLLDLRLPDFEAHLYVDYFTTDGMVVHLLPNPSEPVVRLEAGRTRRLGGPQEGQRFWTIGPPFGHELVVAYASPTPVFAHPRPEAEPAGRYLADLMVALVDSPDVVADAVFVTTTAP